MIKPISVECQFCEEVYSFIVIEEDYDNWKNGNGYIQDIMPYLSDNLRELLISNTCGKCFDKMFG